MDAVTELKAFVFIIELVFKKAELEEVVCECIETLLTVALI